MLWGLGLNFLWTTFNFSWSQPLLEGYWLQSVEKPTISPGWQFLLIKVYILHLFVRVDNVWLSLWVRKAVYFSVVNRCVSHVNSRDHSSAHVERKKGWGDCCNIYLIILFNYSYVEDPNPYRLFKITWLCYRKNMSLQPTLSLQRSHPFRGALHPSFFLAENAILVLSIVTTTVRERKCKYNDILYIKLFWKHKGISVEAITGMIASWFPR